MALRVFGTARRIEDWRERGLLDAATARRLLDDLEAGKGAQSFATVAVWLGIVCLGFGAMTFVAANWDGMPRLLRMLVLLGGMLVSYIAAAVLHRRDFPALAEAFVLLGCGIFGAAVMLTGQMYHLPGPPAGGVLLWSLGTLGAALATGSGVALGLALILATLWTAMTMTTGGGDPFHLWFLPLWAVFAALAWWRHARPLAHLCAMAILVWLAVSLIDLITRSDSFLAGYVAAMAALAGISAVIASAGTVRLLRGFEGSAALYLLGLLFGVVAMLYGWREMESPAVSMPVLLGVALVLAGLALWPAFLRPDRFDHGLAAIWIGATVLVAALVAQEVPYTVEAFALALSIWTIRMGGRQGWKPVTSLGYLAFAVTMFLIYSVAAHGLLGTSLFYLGAGVLLLFGALVVPRIVAHRGAKP